MSKINTSPIRASLCIGASLQALVLAAPLMAQEAAPAEQPSLTAQKAETTEDQVIVVTGSRIARPNYETIEPSVVIDAEQIEARGFETLGQALNEQPTFGVPGASPVGGQSSFGQGQSFVNFLGLGSQRTLTLVNSRRFVSSNTSSIFGPTGSGSQVDLNLIPTKLVERVETIAVGGAPIYGSDAIAGTINVVLKRNFSGIDLDGQYGISEQGDAENYRFRGIVGHNFANGRGNVTFAAEYNKGRGLTWSDRELTRRDYFFGNANEENYKSQYKLYADYRIPALAEQGIPLVFDFFPLSPENEESVFGPGINFGVLNADGRQVRFDDNGNLIPIEFGTLAAAPGDFDIFFAGGNGFTLVPVTNLLTDTERYSAILTGEYELTDGIRIFGEAWYTTSQGRNLRDQPVYNTALFDDAGTADGNIIMSVDNPYLSDEVRTAIIDSINTWYSDQNLFGVEQDYFYLARANTDLATGQSTGKVNVQRYVLGFDGKFNLMGRDWNWELVGNYGRSKTTGSSRELIQQNFANAVDAVLDDNGNIVCRPGHTSASIPSINPTCAPLNLFGYNVASQAAKDYVTAIARPVSLNEQTVVTASLAGPVMELPGGDLSVAFGFEHREETQKFDPGDFFRGELQDDGSYVSYGRSVPIQPVNGKFKTNEVFGEMRADVISPSTNSFIDTLELQAAGRYVDHSVAGGDFTWTFGGRMKPIRDITLRGNYTQSIRAPAITEAFNPSSEFFGFASDPCDNDNLTKGPNPTVRAANCAAAGIPTNFNSLANSRSFKQAVSGNPDLDNEKAKSWTVGVVLQPSAVPQLRFSVDYVDIKLSNAIAELSGSQVVEGCYDSSSYPNNQFCSRFTRDEDNQLDFIETGYFNASELRYKGYIGSLDYRFPMTLLKPEGLIGLTVSYQYLDTLTSRADAGSEPSQTHGSIGYSRNTAVATLNYADDFFGMFLQANYTGKTQIDPQADADTYPDGLGDIPSVTFINAGVTFNIAKRYELRFMVDNLFDKEPAYPYPATGGTITYFPGVLGRYFRMGLGVSF